MLLDIRCSNPGYTLGELPKLKKMYSVFAPVFDVIEFPDAVLGTFVQKGECQLKVRIYAKNINSMKSQKCHRIASHWFQVWKTIL